MEGSIRHKWIKTEPDDCLIYPPPSYIITILSFQVLTVSIVGLIVDKSTRIKEQLSIYNELHVYRCSSIFFDGKASLNRSVGDPGSRSHASICLESDPFRLYIFVSLNQKLFVS